MGRSSACLLGIRRFSAGRSTPVPCVLGAAGATLRAMGATTAAIRREADAKSKAASKGVQEKCGAKRKGGKEPCQRPAGWGTDHPGYGPCKVHGGATRNHTRHAQKVMAAQAVATFGLPIRVEPHVALLDELARTAGHVQWLGAIVAELDEDSVVGPIGTEGTDAESGLQHHPRAEASIWVRLYQEERGHLAKVAETCIRVGIEERRVQIAEEQGQLLAKVIQGVLADLSIPAEKARPVVRKHLQLVAGGAAG